MKRNPQRLGLSELGNGPELLLLVKDLSTSKVDPESTGTGLVTIADVD